MNLHGNTTTEFVRQWQAGESPLYSSMADRSRWDGAGLALGQEPATFEAMFNALPAATVVTDLHGEIRLVNPAFTTLIWWGLSLRSSAKTLHTVAEIPALHAFPRSSAGGPRLALALLDYKVCQTLA